MNWRAAVAVAVTTAGFAVSLALRDRLDPWISTAAVGVVGIGLATWTLGPRIRELLASSWRTAAAAAGLGILLVVATHAVYRGVASLSPQLADEVRTLYGSITAGYGRLPLVGLTLVVVLAEELVWRGVAIELIAADRRVLAGATSVVLYALPQALAGAWLLVLAAVGLGALFAAQRLVTGRITDGFITHAVWSLAIFVVFPLV